MRTIEEILWQLSQMLRDYVKARNFAIVHILSICTYHEAIFF